MINLLPEQGKTKRRIPSKKITEKEVKSQKKSSRFSFRLPKIFQKKEKIEKSPKNKPEQEIKKQEQKKLQSQPQQEFEQKQEQKEVQKEQKEKAEKKVEKKEKEEQAKKRIDEKKSQEQKQKQEPEFFVFKEKKPTVLSKTEVPEVTLMPEKEIPIPRLVKERIFLFITGIIIILSVSLIIYLVLSLYQQKEISQSLLYRSEINSIESKIKALLPKRSEVKRLQEKSTHVDTLLENHIYWTKIFYYLERYTLPEVSWGDFSADTSGTLHLYGTAKDIPTVIKQLLVFSQANDFIKKVEISGVTFDEQANFALEIELVEDIFKGI